MNNSINPVLGEQLFDPLTLPTFLGGESDSGVDWSGYDNTSNTTPVVFNTESTSYCTVLTIDQTHLLLVYRGFASKARARIVEINPSDGSITTSGSEAELTADSVQGITACLLDSTHAVIGLEDAGELRAQVIEFSGTTISTVGSVVNFETVGSESLSLTALSSTVFLYAYEKSSDGTGNVYYGSVAGTIVTAGNKLAFEPNQAINPAQSIQIKKMRSDKAVIIAGHDGADDMEAYLISVSGTTPVLDHQVSVKSVALTTFNAVSIDRLTDTTMLVAFNDYDAVNHEAAIITEASDELTSTTPVEIFSNIVAHSSLVAIDENQAMLTTIVQDDGIYTNLIAISGTTITPGTSYEVVNGDKEWVSTSLATDNDYISVMYEDDDNSSKGTLILLKP